MVGSTVDLQTPALSPSVSPPLWLLAELTYACPLQCPYCSNPLDFADYLKRELSTDQWVSVLRQGRELGAVQLGFSGGEPAVRRDLEHLVEESRQLGFYSNLITSGYGLDEARIGRLKAAGLDHIQVSFQASDAEMNDFLAGTRCFDQKREIAAAVKAHGYPMVLCCVIHRHNVEHLGQIIEMARELGADYLELATAQYYGWALKNRGALLPTRTQVEQAEAVAHDYQNRFKGKMKIYYVVPDYFEGRPKACAAGWAKLFLNIAPDGTALPCHAAKQLPLEFPNVRDQSLASIWRDSAAFNRFRGRDWMRAPCRSCPEQEKDFGGCRCQAFMLTGDAENTDPACNKSPHHGLVTAALADQSLSQPLIFRRPQNAS